MSHGPVETPKAFGMMAEFDDHHHLIKAAEAAHAAGYRKMDAYTPYPIHGLSEALGQAPTKISTLVLCGGVLGCLGGFSLMCWITLVAYPMNVAGKPMYSWPAYIPITFETTVLVAALTAVFGMIALNGLPQPYHPVFNVERFKRASQDRFFLCIEAVDPKYDAAGTREFLGKHSAEVMEVDA
ncbi:MAG: DUF3341 domain-containing protein [Acidobacteriota bacterium]